MESGVSWACVPVRGVTNHEWFVPCLVSWLPRTSPPRFGGRTETDFGSRPRVQSSTRSSANYGWTGSSGISTSTRNHGVDCAPTALGGMARSMSVRPRKPVVTTTQLAAALGDVDDTASSIELAQEWWRSTAPSQSIELDSASKRIVPAIRRHANPVCVRVDSAFGRITAIAH